MKFNSVPERKEFKKGQFIRPGIQTLILRNVTLQESRNTGNQRPVFSMETEPITDAGWEGKDGALGQIGNISGNFGYYLKNDNQKIEFVRNLRDIMKAVGTYDNFMAEHGDKDFGFDQLPAMIEVVKPFIVGHLARYFVVGEQYSKLDGTGVGLKLKFPSRHMVESLNSESTFPKFDETNPNHFKKIPRTGETPAVVEKDDMPF